MKKCNHNNITFMQRQNRNLGSLRDDLKKTARICKVLSVDTRLKMIHILQKRSLCVNALARVLGITPAAVSQHLRILRDADIVIAERRGYFIHYQVNQEELEKWYEVLREFFMRNYGEWGL